MPGSVLNTLQIFTHLTLTTLGSRYSYHPYFPNEETEAERLNDLPQVTQLANGRWLRRPGFHPFCRLSLTLSEAFLLPVNISNNSISSSRGRILKAFTILVAFLSTCSSAPPVLQMAQGAVREGCRPPLGRCPAPVPIHGTVSVPQASTLR